MVVSLTALTAYTQTSAPDNTETNRAERAANIPSADQQSNEKSDLELTRQIRRSLTSDSSLSLDAHNVKIISKNGNVTLAGPVQTDSEKAAIGAKAEAIAGAGKVSNQLLVKHQ
jgi:osmotically-inducible protein OsmY